MEKSPVMLAAAAAVLAVCASLALSGCATPAASPGGAPADPSRPGDITDTMPEAAPPTGDVVGQGTVLDTGGEVVLCIGGVAESYPPQCIDGLPLEGWDWTGIDGSESSGDVRWGAYAVRGTYDGARLTVTEPPIMLALYDPLPMADPTGGRSGTADPAELDRILDELVAGGDGVVTAAVQDGWLRIQVLWDDGSVQEWFDDVYGENLGIVDSILREVSG